MSKTHILLLENIHPCATDIFASYGLEVHRIDKALSEQGLIDALQKFPSNAPRMLGIRSKTHISDKVLAAVPELAAVGAFCIGTDQIDLRAARKRGVAVFNAPFSNTRSVAELVLGEIIMLSRQVFARSMGCHRGEWQKSAAGSHEVRGKTLGIIGYGHIGSQLSILAEALGLHVYYYDIVRKLPLGNARPCTSLDELLQISNFVSLHVPDTEATRWMIGAEQLRRMPQGSYLINASRGQVVDIDALYQALHSNHLAGAAIDVFPKEPKSTEDRFESSLCGLKQVILTPHIGGSTQEAQANIGHEVAASLCHYWTTGATTGSVTLPMVDAPPNGEGCRLINIHQNVPGVLSAINRVVAESEVNVNSQHLATVEDIGLLLVDLSLAKDDPKVQGLYNSIVHLPTSVRTRIVD